VDTQTFTVAELGLTLANAFQHLFADDVWVTGEIRNLSRARSGHVYFDLVEPTSTPGATPSAKFRVTLFSGTKVVINKLLKRAGNIRMEDGMQIRVRAAIDFYEVRGELYLRMTSIDPTYTLGLMAAERDQLLQTLAADGLLRANAANELPLVPLHVGLITSRGSAAEADFLDELHRSSFGFRVAAIDTAVQGPAAEQAVCEALLTLHSHDVDVIAIVRGGGSRTDLVVFDAESIARTIASLSIPVVTGIGHEVDRSVADEVAHTAHKTPTACAAALVDTVIEFVGRIDTTWQHIASRAATIPVVQDEHVAQVAKRTSAAARSALRLGESSVGATASRISQASVVALAAAGSNLDRSGDTISSASQRHLRQAARSVDETGAILVRRFPRVLERASRDIDGLEQRVRGLDPARTLARGWSMTKRPDGTVVRSSADLTSGDTLVSTFAHGSATSTVASTTPGET
jgi:exodeoxyribonuclease VII large subunit